MNTNLTQETFEKLTIGDVGVWAYLISLHKAGARITLDMVTSTTKLSQHKFVQHLTNLMDNGVLKYEAKVVPSKKSKTVEYTIMEMTNNEFLSEMDARVVQLFMALVGSEGIGVYAYMKNHADTNSTYYSEGFRKDAKTLNVSTTTLQKMMKLLEKNGLIKKGFYQGETGKRQTCYELIGFHELHFINVLRLPPLARDLYLRAVGEVGTKDISVYDYSKGIYNPTLRNFYFEYRHPLESEKWVEFPSRIKENDESIMVNNRFTAMATIDFKGIKVIGRKEDLEHLAILEEANMSVQSIGAVTLFLNTGRKLANETKNVPYILLREGEETTTQGLVIYDTTWHSRFLHTTDLLKIDTTNAYVSIQN